VHYSKTPSTPTKTPFRALRCPNEADITLDRRLGGGQSAILASDCEHLLIDNVTVKTSMDGLSLLRCNKVEVAYCHIEAVQHDDGYPAGGGGAIIVRSGPSLDKAQGGGEVVVRNCYLAGGAAPLQFGEARSVASRSIRLEDTCIRRYGSGR
jgi:hypothetical protein